MSTEIRSSSHFGNLQHEHNNPITFSFDNIRTEAFERIASTKKQIDQYLRLKTNESIEQKPHAAATQYDQTCGKAQNKKNKGNKNAIKLEDNIRNQNDHSFCLMQEENDLRIVSITKQYELKLGKQQQYFELRQWKLKEQNENLRQQNLNLQQQVKKVRNSHKTSNVRCQKCSDGETINNLTRMLQEIEENHKDCIDRKKELTHHLDQKSSRLSVIEVEHQKLYQQSKNYTKQIRSLNQKITKLQTENQEFKKTIEEREQKLKAQTQRYESTIRQIHTKMNIIQQSSTLRHQEPQNVNSSKISVNSTHSPFINNNQNSLKSSYMKQNFRDYPEPLSKGRASMSKIMQSIQNIDKRQNQPSAFYRKASEDKNSQKSRLPNMELLKWKYF